MDRPTSPVVAHRYLKAVSDDSAVAVSIWAPEPAEPTDWRCVFEITGAGFYFLEQAHGIDSMQALQNAFRGIRSMLEEHFEKLRWVGEAGELGFPRTIPDEFGRDVEKELIDLVDREMERKIREKRQNPGST